MGWATTWKPGRSLTPQFFGGTESVSGSVAKVGLSFSGFGKWNNLSPVLAVVVEKCSNSWECMILPIRAFQRTHRLRLMGAPRILRSHIFFVVFQYP